MILEMLWMVHRLSGDLVRQQQAWRKDLASWSRFWRSYRRYRKITPAACRPRVRYLSPCLGDDTADTPIEPIYYYQDAWAFERIVQRRPADHVDVGSHHKFVSLLSKVVPVTMVDIRPLSLPMNSVRFQQGSILKMPYADGVLPSVSSICVVEHIGLGRYGDPLDWQGSEKAIAELKRVVAPGGDLYISLPLDDVNRVYFNAHRAFLESYIETLIQPFEVKDRWYIQGNLFSRDAHPGFRVGCYHLVRPHL